MAGIFAYRCKCCGEVHEGSPSFGFPAPDHYSWLTDEQKAQFGYLDSDFCEVTIDNRTDFFIRTVLEIPIHEASEPFLWGVWVSVSSKSYQRYQETFGDSTPGDGFFGWLNNALPWYPEAGNLGADVYLQAGGDRPVIRLHLSGVDDHPLVLDQINGISVATAQEIAEFVMHPPQRDAYRN